MVAVVSKMFGSKLKTKEINPIRDHGKRFKSVDETFRLYTFILSVNMMFPNPKTDTLRHFGIFGIIMYCVPFYAIMTNDIIIRLREDDIENLVRQAIVYISLLFVNMKSVLTLVYKKELREIFDDVSRDYDAFNDLPEDYQELVADTVKKAKQAETGWVCIIGFAALMFPGNAIFLNLYFMFFTDTSRRFMIHECYLWNLTPEQAQSSPLYEIFFVYCFFIATIIFMGYTGYDGMFSVCTFYISLKFKILAKKFHQVLGDTSDLQKMKLKIAEIVKEQNRIWDFKDKMMICYEVWLVVLFILSVIQCGMALTQTASTSSGANLIFVVFMIATSCAIFFPCYMSSEVTHTASEFAYDLYSSPWEDITDPSIRRTIVFMIARAQIPLRFTALKLLTFNMEMYVSVMQTAYSMFTLLRR